MVNVVVAYFSLNIWLWPPTDTNSIQIPLESHYVEIQLAITSCMHLMHAWAYLVHTCALLVHALVSLVCSLQPTSRQAARGFAPGAVKGLKNRKRTDHDVPWIYIYIFFFFPLKSNKYTKPAHHSALTLGARGAEAFCMAERKLI